MVYSTDRKELWNIFYSEVIGNILITGIYNDYQLYPSNFSHDAKSFHLWISNMKNQFETEDVEKLQEYTQQVLSYK